MGPAAEAHEVQVPMGPQPCHCPVGTLLPAPILHEQSLSLALRTPPISFNVTLMTNGAWKKNSHHFPLSATNVRAVLLKKPAGPCSATLPSQRVTTRVFFILLEEKRLSAGFETSFCI